MNWSVFLMSEADYQIDGFMTSCQLKQLSKKTMESYEQSLKLFFNYLGNNFTIYTAERVRKYHIAAYIEQLKARGKYTVFADEHTEVYNHPQNRQDYKKQVSVTTINNYIRNIKVFFNWLYDNHEITKNPVNNVKQLKQDRQPLRFITEDEFKALLKAMDKSKFSEYRDSVIIQLLIDTGMRIGECLLTQIVNVDLKTCSIFIPLENTKGKKSRSVFFSPDMSKILKLWLKYQDRYYQTDYLFCTNEGKTLQVRNFVTNFNKYAERIGLKDVHPHCLRNNFAKRFLMAGGNIYTLSRILGHSSVEVTQKAYLDIDDDDLMQGYQQFSPLSNIKANKNSRRR